MRRLFYAVVSNVVFSVSSSPALAGKAIVVEATNVYTGCSSSLQHNIQNVQGLYNGMTTVSGVSWTKSFQNYDSNAWDSDMLDSEKISGGTDNQTMDLTANAISMYSGHGICDNASTQSCTSAANCTSPGPGQSLPGVCTWPGQCMYFVPRKALTCGSGDAFGHLANLTSGNARFGESTSSGSWAGAGTNGNVNFVIMDISCGATPGLGASEYWNAFAGAHIFSTIMPTAGSDTLDVSNRGSALAARYRANVNGSASVSWLDAMNAVSGGWCWAGFQDGHGISGCGAYVSYSVAESQSWVQFLNSSESWSALQNDSNDALGGGFIAWIYQCNFNCSQVPISY